MMARSLETAFDQKLQQMPKEVSWCFTCEGTGVQKNC